MQQIVIDKPYRFVPPCDSRFWPGALNCIVPWYLDRAFGITRVECQGVDRLRQSLAAGHGILLAPNHCRDNDPIALGILARESGAHPFLMASWHVFMQNRLRGWLLRRAGAFSIYREGMDRAAVNAATEILEQAKRPLVIFPEGVVSRTNDRLNALMDGTALIARTAAKRRAKLTPAGKVVVHPIALRYRFHGDIEQSLRPVLDRIETGLGWRPQKHLSLIDRIYKLGWSLLFLKEMELLGEPQTGALEERLQRLIDHLLNPLEDEWVNSQHDGTVVARVKRLRFAILPDLVKGEITEEERERRWRQLADVYLAQQLSHYPADYIADNPTPDRLMETVERFEEDLTDVCTPHRPMSVTIQVGEAIEVSPTRESRDGDDLMSQIERSLKQMLGIPAEQTVP